MERYFIVQIGLGKPCADAHGGGWCDMEAREENARCREED